MLGARSWHKEIEFQLSRTERDGFSALDLQKEDRSKHIRLGVSQSLEHIFALEVL